MDDQFETQIATRPIGNPGQPLHGLTLLLVEDSRYCSEAVRLMCQQSGARLRRADTLKSAHRHLATYRPSLVLVDIGLPDGSGLDLIAELARARPNAPVILATSGGDPQESRARAEQAGADGFLAKPVPSVKAFQDLILSFFADRRLARADNVIGMRRAVKPDQRAVADDLRALCKLLEKDEDPNTWHERLAYGAQFLRSVSETAADEGLHGLAEQISRMARASAGDRAKNLPPVLAALQRRIADYGVI